MILKLSLKSFFKTNKLLSISFLVLMVICFVALLFGINYGFCNSDFYNRYESKQKLYIIDRISPNDNIKNSIEEFIETNKHNLDYIYVNCQCSNYELFDENHDLYNKENINNDSIIDIKLFNFFIPELNDLLKSYYGESFTEEDIKSGAKKIILSEDFDKSLIGSKIRIFNDYYEVIGISSVAYIPLNSVDISTNKETIKNIEIVISSIIKNNDERETFNDYLRKTFTFCKVIVPTEDYKTIWDYIPMLIPTILVVLIGLFNLGFLYAFFINKRKKNIAIYQICGASRYECFKVLTFELLTIVTLTFALSITLYKVIMLTIFPKTTLAEMTEVGLCVYDTLNIVRISFIYLMLLFTTLIVFLPYIIKSNRNVKG